MLAPPACPGCGQINYVERVAVVVETDDSGFAHSMRPAGPPRPPSPSGGGAVLLVICVLWFVPAVVMAVGSGSGFLGFVIVFCVAPAAYGLCYIWGSHSRRLKWQFLLDDFQDLADRYNQAIRLWQEMKYCGRCRGVYLPGHDWQTAVNPKLTLLRPEEAWSYALRLEGFLWWQRARVIVTEKGVVSQG